MILRVTRNWRRGIPSEKQRKSFIRSLEYMKKKDPFVLQLGRRTVCSVPRMHAKMFNPGPSNEIRKRLPLCWLTRKCCRFTPKVEIRGHIENEWCKLWNLARREFTLIFCSLIAYTPYYCIELYYEPYKEREPFENLEIHVFRRFGRVSTSLSIRVSGSTIFKFDKRSVCL